MTLKPQKIVNSNVTRYQQTKFKLSSNEVQNMHWTNNFNNNQTRLSERTTLSSQFIHSLAISMATFNMQDFNEILEKCKDQSQQQKQDQVSLRARSHSNVIGGFCGLCKFVMTMIFLSIFRRCCNRLYTYNRFQGSKCDPSSDSPSTSGLTYRLKSSLPLAKSFRCCTTQAFCKSQSFKLFTLMFVCCNNKHSLRLEMFMSEEKCRYLWCLHWAHQF